MPILRGFFAFLICLSLCGLALAQKYVVTNKIAFPGNQTYWDYLTVDSPNRLLYVTRGNEVMILNLDSGKELARIPNLKRAHGVALVHEFHKGFVSDGGENEVIVFDLVSNAVTNRIKVGQAPDAVLYEPTKKRVYAFNAHSRSVSVIDAQSETIVTTVPLSGIPEFATTDGKGNVFVNIESKNSIVRLDAKGSGVLHEWSLSPCESPSSLAFDPQGRRLFSVCDNKLMIVTDADSGKQIARVGVGVEPDSVVYDPGRKLLFVSNCDGTLTLVKQENPDKYTVLQTLRTEQEARTMALDLVSQKIFLPFEEVKPGQPHPAPGTLPEFTPGTFRILVAAPQE
jgi:YVTN family beta-propeller protein